MYKIRLNSDLSLWNDTTTSYISKIGPTKPENWKNPISIVSIIKYNTLLGVQLQSKPRGQLLKVFSLSLGKYSM